MKDPILMQMQKRKKAKKERTREVAYAENILQYFLKRTFSKDFFELSAVVKFVQKWWGKTKSFHISLFLYFRGLFFFFAGII